MFGKKYIAIIKPVLTLILFVCGIFLPFAPLRRLDLTSGLYTLLIIFASGIISGWFKRGFLDAFVISSSVGLVFGFAYGIAAGLLAVISGALLYFISLKLELKDLMFLGSFDDLIGAYSLAYLAAYPIYRFLDYKLFFAAFPFLFIGFIYGLRLLGNYIYKTSYEVFFLSKERTFLLFPLSLAASFGAVSFTGNNYIFPLIAVGAMVPVIKVSNRFENQEPKKIIEKAAEFLEKQVFQSEGTLVSAESFAKAISETSSFNLEQEKLFKVYLLAALYWAPLSRTLFRQPDKLSPPEAKILRENAEIIKEVMIEAGYEEDVVQGVYQFYENYDGSGVIGAAEDGDISVLSRFGRALEKYLMLTTWRENFEPISDEDAVNILKDEAGKVLDPHIVEELASMVLPESAARKENAEEEKEAESSEENREEIESAVEEANEEGDEDAKE